MPRGGYARPGEAVAGLARTAPELVAFPAIAAVLTRLDAGSVVDLTPVAEGLMNRNWRVTTTRGVYAVKQVLDVDAEQARRQHDATRVLAARGLPVPAPCATPGGQTLFARGGGIYAVSPWVPGRYRHGLDLGHGECAALRGLLAHLQAGLGENLLPTASALTLPVATVAKVTGRIERYLALIDQRPTWEDFDRFTHTGWWSAVSWWARWRVCAPTRPARSGQPGGCTGTSTTATCCSTIKAR